MEESPNPALKNSLCNTPPPPHALKYWHTIDIQATFLFTVPIASLNKINNVFDLFINVYLFSFAIAIYIVSHL